MKALGTHDSWDQPPIVVVTALYIVKFIRLDRLVFPKGHRLRKKRSVALNGSVLFR